MQTWLLSFLKQTHKKNSFTILRLDSGLCGWKVLQVLQALQVLMLMLLLQIWKMLQMLQMLRLWLMLLMPTDAGSTGCKSAQVGGWPEWECQLFVERAPDRSSVCCDRLVRSI